jgi:phospholipase/carboxylesterase
MTGYHFQAHDAGPARPLLFLLHGTGGDETQLWALGWEVLPEGGLIAMQGDVLEGGARRFFRRLKEGVYDMDDLAARTAAVAAFMEEQIERRKPSHVLGLGYSNGANMLASVMFDRPDLMDAVALMHPLIPFEPEIEGPLKTAVLITAGRHDPICPPEMTSRLESYLKATGGEVSLHWHGGGHELRTEEVAAVRDFMARWRQSEEKA